MCCRVVRVQRQCSTIENNGFGQRFDRARVFEDLLAAPIQDERIDVRIIVHRLERELRAFRQDQPQVGNRNVGDVAQNAVEVLDLCPEVSRCHLESRFRVHELDIDVQQVVDQAHAALDIESDAQSPPNFARCRMRAHRPGIAARGDGRARNPRKAIDQFLRETAGKDLRLFAAVDIEKLEYGDRVGIYLDWPLLGHLNRGRLNFGLRQPDVPVIDEDRDGGDCQRADDRHVGSGKPLSGSGRAGARVQYGFAVTVLEEPGQQQHDREARDHEIGHKAARPVRQQQLLEHDVGDLQQQPAGDEISQCRLENTALPHILEEARLVQPCAGLFGAREGRFESQAVAAPRQGLDERRALCGVVQRPANLGNRLVQHFFIGLARAPYFPEQGFPGNERTRRVGKAKQHFHCFRRQHFGKPAPRHAALERLNEEVPQEESLQKFCFHMVAGTTVSISRSYHLEKTPILVCRRSPSGP